MRPQRGTTSLDELAVLMPGQTYGSVTDDVLNIPLRPPGFRWIAGFGVGLSLTMLMGFAILWLLIAGVGIWGINIPVAWGFAIINFVWWIGIGHAGTLISAILLLMRQSWRTSINRFAEAMTLFAVINAGLFPLLHLGRITRFYYLVPYPDTLGLWPQWRSPLVADVFAVATYFTVSLLFWYVGLLPDLASLRDTAKRRAARLAAGIFALGWRGSAKHWQRHQMVYLLLAGLATPLVVSVHTIVSFDFALSILPGWHTTIFPPYFVAGAIFAGFAMVILIAIVLRAGFGLQGLITLRHLDNMAKIMLVSGLIVTYGYLMEHFTAWFSADSAEHYLIANRSLGPYGFIFWITIFCNVISIQALWFRWIRLTATPLFLIAVLVNVGMWTERFMIIPVSLHRDYLPSSWGMYAPTFWDWALFIGTIGFFLALMFLFIKLLPAISISEVRELLHHDEPGTAVNAETDGEREAGEADREALADVPDVDLYGLVAEFDRPDRVIEAARRARAAGYERMEAYTPFPIPELSDALGYRTTRLPLLVLIGGVLGAGGGFFMQWYASVIDYPWNVGGRPFNSWPSYIPITFELGILTASLFGVVGMIALNRLPHLYHPLFNVPSFARASRDRFFLCIETSDARFDRDNTQQFLEQSQPLRVLAAPK